MKSKLFLTFNLLFISLGLFAQSPWLKGQNKAYVQVGLSSIQYSQVRYDGTQFDTGRNNSDVTLQAYAEYGITDKLDATAILPYKMLGYEDKTTAISERFSGLGNVTLGLKYRLSDKAWKMATGLHFSANSIQSDEVLGFRTGFDASTILPYFTIGSSKGKFYYFGNFGYGYMTNDYSDYLKVGLEAGYKFWKNMHVITVFDLRKSITKEAFYTNDALSYVQTSNYLDRQDFLAFGVKLNYEFVKDKYGVNLSGYGAFDYDNSPAAAALNIGIYTKL